MDWIGETIETYRWAFLMAPPVPVLLGGPSLLTMPHVFLCVVVLAYIQAALLGLPLLWFMRRFGLLGLPYCLLAGGIVVLPALYLYPLLSGWGQTPASWHEALCASLVWLGAAGGLIFWGASLPRLSWPRIDARDLPGYLLVLVLFSACLTP
jgi:hypothetical protein